MNEDTITPESLRPPHLAEKLKETYKEPNRGINWKEILKEIITLVIVVFGIIIPFRVYVAEPYLVDGRSMDPTFETGDYLIVDKISSSAKHPDRNSVIVFKYPNDTSKSFIKRVIGLPGETVIIKNDIVTIVNTENPNGFVLDQSYVTHESSESMEKVLGSTEYFVMGDNRKESFDSRYWGPLDEKYILGRPILQLLPLNKIRTVPGDE